LADLDIIERWPHGMTVPYVPPGQDATISYGARDFKFRNSVEHPILIWAEKVENTLYMAFYSNADAPEVTWHHQTLKRWPTYIIQKYNARLRPGEMKIVHSGADGIWVKNWVTVKYKSGKVISKKLGIDYYAPLPEIVEIGGR
jgi:vancomycin resistance protein YoaR